MGLNFMQKIFIFICYFGLISSGFSENNVATPQMSIVHIYNKNCIFQARRAVKKFVALHVYNAGYKFCQKDLGPHTALFPNQVDIKQGDTLTISLEKGPDCIWHIEPVMQVGSKGFYINNAQDVNITCSRVGNPIFGLCNCK